MTMTWVNVKTTSLLDRELNNCAPQLPTAIADMEKGSLPANESIIQRSSQYQQSNKHSLRSICPLAKEKKEGKKKILTHTETHKNCLFSLVLNKHISHQQALYILLWGNKNYVISPGTIIKYLAFKKVGGPCAMLREFSGSVEVSSHITS